MKEYLRFVKWKGEYALFKKATIVDKLIVMTGIGLLCRCLNIKEGDVILIKSSTLIETKKKTKSLGG